LVLSGHTHGGQVVLPWIGAPIVPSGYGQKYRYGLVQSPGAKIYVTSGVGTLPIAVRINCPPEVALITLRGGGLPS
jgi:predicted MPP superfamily phosphohydrolase